jgi:ATP-dependent protease ClpP protease subunit
MPLLLNVKQAGTLKYDLYIYDDVEPDGYDWWTGEKEVSETSANYYRDALAAIPATAQINLYVNSLGGSVKEGLGIYTQLKRHPAQKVGYNDGYACSIASVILMACDRVIMPRNTLMMIHQAHWAAYGNPAQLRKSADDLDVINEATMQSYLMKCGEKLPKETLAALLEKESWLTAEDCMGYGLIDEYADYDADMTAARHKLEETQAAATAHSKNSPAAAYFASFTAAALSSLPKESTPTDSPTTPDDVPTPDNNHANSGTGEPEQKTKDNQTTAAFERLLNAFIN